MRITLSIDGGLAYLPALSAPRTLDVDGLPERTRVELRALIDALAQSPPRLSASSMPDARTYTISIDDRARTTTYRFSDPVADPRCAALLDALRGHLSQR